MKYLNFTLIFTLSFFVSEVYAQVPDQDKKPAIVFVEDGSQNVAAGRAYRSSLGGATRGGNGNSDNLKYGNIGDWALDLMITEKSSTQAATDFGSYKDNDFDNLITIGFNGGTQVWPLRQTGIDSLSQRSNGKIYNYDPDPNIQGEAAVFVRTDGGSIPLQGGKIIVKKFLARM